MCFIRETLESYFVRNHTSAAVPKFSSVLQENDGTVIYKIIGGSDYYRNGEGYSILKCGNASQKELATQ